MMNHHFAASTLRRTLFALLICALPAWSSPRSDAWKLRQSDPKAALSQLQQVVRDDPNDAKAFWFMALIFKDQNREGEALQALQQARRADPSLAFAGSAQTVEKIERSLQSEGGQAPSASQPANRSVDANQNAAPNLGFSQQEMLAQLDKTGVFVAPAMRQIADPNQIAQAIKGANRKVNVLVLDTLPPSVRGSGTLLADQVHDFLHLGDGLCIVVTGRPRLVAVSGASLDGATLQSIAQGAARTFDGESYAAGIGQIVRDVDQEASQRESQGRNLILLLVGVPAVAITLIVRRNRKRNVAQTEEERVETRDLSSKLAPEMEKLDSDFEYALLAEKDPTRKSALQAARSKAGEAFSQAIKRGQNANDVDGFNNAQRALQMAELEMHRARNVLEGKPEDDGVAQLTQAHAAALPQNDEIPPMGANLPGAQQGYALDFFTSQPVPQNQMVPVDIEINGQRRRVWASPQSAQAALSGQPQIAAVNYQGRQMPWFDVPQYNPWRDAGSTMLQMMAMNMLFQSMTGGYGGNYGYGYGGGFGGGFGYGGGFNGGFGGDDFDRNPISQRDDAYDNRMADASRDAGQASLDSPIFGGAMDSSSQGGGSSLDIFGGGGFGGDSS